jgi:molybdate transport system substrate-binding protein
MGAALGLVTLGACGRTPPPEATITVFAASSLKDVLEDVAAVFAGEHPDVRVVFNFAGSQELRTQIEQGAAPDVFAAAELAPIEVLVNRGLASEAVLLVENELVIVVAREAAATVTSFGELARAERIVLGAQQAPIGRYSETILENAARSYGEGFKTAVAQRVVSRDLNVRQVLSKVVLGEAQAGIVYRTDVTAAVRDLVTVVDIPAPLNVKAAYWIAFVGAREAKPGAREWVTFSTKRKGRDVFTRHGFSLPTSDSSGQP